MERQKHGEKLAFIHASALARKYRRQAKIARVIAISEFVIIVALVAKQYV